MHYGRGNKLDDEINPTGRNDRYFSKENFEMLFYLSAIFAFLSLFFANDNFIFFAIATGICWLLSKLFR